MKLRILLDDLSYGAFLQAEGELGINTHLGKPEANADDLRGAMETITRGNPEGDSWVFSALFNAAIAPARPILAQKNGSSGRTRTYNPPVNRTICLNFCHVLLSRIFVENDAFN